MKDHSALPPAVQLLTLINVAQARPESLKRKRPDWHAMAKKAAKSTSTSSPSTASPVTEPIASTSTAILLAAAADDDEDDETEEKQKERDAYERHWAWDTPLVANKTVDEMAETKWRKSTTKVKGWGEFSQSIIADQEEAVLDGDAEDKAARIYNARLLEKLHKYNLTSTSAPDRDSFLKLLASYRDVLYPKVTLEQHDDLRVMISTHAMNHVLRTRTKVLKNNDHLAKLASTKATSTRNTQDQGFTRPKVLILLPFRNSALSWISHLTSTATTSTTIENLSRFQAEYALPDGAVDKLATQPENYPKDHVQTFKGNIDDSFRMGVKVTRKSLKLFAEFYSADIIIASPLGLRTSIEKEKDSDFLSSIEMLIVDPLDVMLMQNWDHVQFVLDRLNKTPSETHGSDLFRVKPWYLDQKSANLRQSILLSSYETPEIRALFARGLTNAAGKIRAEPSYEGVLTEVPKGLKQVFTRFDAPDVYAEDDARFEHFATKTLPMLRKSAVSSSQTIIFVPSYFDFVRVKRHLKKIDDLTFSSISEYSSTPDISRARGAFFKGETAFLLTTERFHFFRRYRLRGAKTFVFYALPDHQAFYNEVVSFPFRSPGSTNVEQDEMDVSELSVQVIFSKFDLLKLERVVGSEDARKMIGGSGAAAGGSRFTFA